MKLKAPSAAIFWVAAALALIGLIGGLVDIPFLTDYSGWILLVAYAVLCFGVAGK